MSGEADTKISAYIRPLAMMNPTGVGKHQINMISELLKRGDVDLELLVPMRDLAKSVMPGDLADVKARLIPWTARTVERLWSFVGWPSLVHECAGSDWLYAPFEAMPPVGGVVPRAVTVHQVMWFDKDMPWYDEWARIRRAQKRLFLRMARECEVILCVSETLKSQFLEAYPCAEGRVHVVWNGADQVFFDMGERQRVERDAYALVIGPLTARKGAPLLFEVADRLARIATEVRIIAVGGKCSSEDMLIAAGRRRNLELREYMPSSAIADLMERASALIQVSPTETFGIPCVEAMAAGVPVIGIKAMATEEVVGDAGILLDPSDVQGLCEAAVNVCSDVGMRTDLTDRGRRRAELYRWSKCADMLVRVLKEKTK